MAESRNNDERTTIMASDASDARGAEGPKYGALGDTLLPMLIGAIALTIVGVFVVFMTVV